MGTIKYSCMFVLLRVCLRNNFEENKLHENKLKLWSQWLFLPKSVKFRQYGLICNFSVSTEKKLDKVIKKRQIGSTSKDIYFISSYPPWGSNEEIPRQWCSIFPSSWHWQLCRPNTHSGSIPTKKTSPRKANSHNWRATLFGR